MAKFSNKVVLITGASSGMGLSCAHAFAGIGAKLILAARREDKLQAVANTLQEKGATVFAKPLDISDAAAVDAFIASIPEALQNIDCLINNAGCALGLDNLSDIDNADLNGMIDTNIKGLVYLTRAVVPGMLKRGSGHVINVGSTSAYNVYPGGGVYCATKSAVQAITKTLRLETVNTGLRVTEIDPGMVETEFSLVRLKGDAEKAKAVYADVKDLITADDIADAIVYAATRPQRMNIAQIMLYSTDQSERLPN